MAHKHYQSMLKYANDAGETDKPWERWEYKQIDSEIWHRCKTLSSAHQNNPAWFSDFEYRRIPDIEAFRTWWLENDEMMNPSDAWTAALKWERSKK